MTTSIAYFMVAGLFAIASGVEKNRLPGVLCALTSLGFMLLGVLWTFEP